MYEFFIRTAVAFAAAGVGWTLHWFYIRQLIDRTNRRREEYRREHQRNLDNVEAHLQMRRRQMVEEFEQATEQLRHRLYGLAQLDDMEAIRKELGPPEEEVRELLDVNSATEDELRSVRGIGAVIARQIVNGRPWQQLEDLVSVDGISLRMLASFRHRLHVLAPADPTRNNRRYRGVRVRRPRRSDNVDQ